MAITTASRRTSLAPAFALALTLLAGAGSGCALQRPLVQAESGGELAGKPAPSFVGTDLDGKPIELAGYAGHPLVLNFWASWCGPCRAEQPGLNRIATDYKARGVAVLGVDIRDNIDAAKIYRDEFQMPYPSLFDQAARVAYAYRVDAPPSTAFIDATGVVVFMVPGGIEESDMRRLIDARLLGQSP